jgi:hypothetical protein
VVERQAEAYSLSKEKKYANTHCADVAKQPQQFVQLFLSSLLTHLLKNTRTKQVGLGHMFRALCDADAAGELQEWLVSETSLEDVFVTIVISGDGVRRTAD